MQDRIDLSALFPNNKEFERELKAVSENISTYSKYKGKLFDSGKTLYEFLEFDSALSKKVERLYLYAHINNDLDLRNETYNTYLGKVMNLCNEISENSTFVVPEILSHDYDEFLKLTKEEPKLNEYLNNIKNVFRAKKYILSEKEETLINMLTTTFNRPEMTSEYLINTDLDYGFIKDENGKKVKLTNSNFSNFMESNNRSVRKNAFKTFYKEIKMHENTFASILATEIINANKIAKIRKFDSARDLSLYQNEVDSKIYDKLIEGVQKNLPKFYEFYNFKQKVLGIEDFHLYDCYANITKEFDKKYSYTEGKELILKSLSILGKDYNKILKKAFDECWIDSKVADGKRDGGYCTCAYLSHPYIVINYENKFNDVSTLAHELGHAMHYHYAKENNTYQDYNYSIFVAEVASQVNEIILLDYMLKNTENIEEKKYLLDTLLQRFKSTIIRQTMFAQYEDLIHQKENAGEILTKENLTKTYYELNKKYFGENVIVDEEIKYEAFRIPHFYYNFYVYQYATGYAAAMKIANDIINQKEGALDAYLEFLKLGSTKNPVDSLKIAGVDITSETIYDEIFDEFTENLNNLRSLYE